VDASPDDTRARILRAAHRRFVDQGYDATSLREIAEDLGFTKAALYYHFPSKADLLRALLAPMAEVFDEVVDRLEAVREAADHLEAWADALAWVVRSVAANRDLFALLDRNRQAIAALLHDGDGPFSGGHAESHSRLDRVFSDLDLPVRDRIRMACAIGAVTGFDDWAPHLLATLDPDVLEHELILMTRSILGLSLDGS